MQLIMPAAPPSLALSNPASPPFVSDHHHVHESCTPPSSGSSPTISAPPRSHGDFPALSDATPPAESVLISSVHDLPSAMGVPLSSYRFPSLQRGPDEVISSHSCKFCNQSFSCSRTLSAHLHTHDTFYALCEGAGSSADIISKADDQHHPNQIQNNIKDNELLIDLSGGCKSETDDQYEDNDLMFVLRRKPKRSRQCADQDFTREDQQDLLNKSISIAGNDHESVGRVVGAGSFKKPMATCKLQDRPPPACTECGREFNSWKALFGHMRCHPEREWRGIQPPAEHIQNGVRNHKDCIARNGTLESNRCIVVKPLQESAQYDMLERKDMRDRLIRYRQPAADVFHDVIKADRNQTREDGLGVEDTVLAGSIGEVDGLKLPWNSCRKQVMLEEEDESETESIEAAYMSSNIKDEQDKCLHLLASFSRGKRSKRSHFTVKSLQSVQDQLAAKLGEGAHEPKDEDLEMANCLVMLALAGGSVDGQHQAAGTASKGDDDDDDEDVVDDQLKLDVRGSDVACTTTAAGESKILHYQNDMTSAASDLDDSTIAGEAGGKYECAACKRSFKSHQALGGHRASHKKVKGCFAKTAADVEAFPTSSKEYEISSTTTCLDSSILTLAAICKDQVATSYTPHLHTSQPELNGQCKDLIEANGMYVGAPAYDQVPGGRHASGKQPGASNKAADAPNLMKKGPAIQLLLGSMDGLTNRSSKLVLHNPSKSHQCSICQRVFSSGQALGGHKRCHWAADKADRPVPETGTGAMFAMACETTPPGVAKLTFFTKPPAVEAATHQVKVLGIDLNFPAPIDVDPIISTNAKAIACKDNTTLGSLLSLGQCSGATIHASVDVDDESFHSGGHHIAGHNSSADPAACSGTSSPTSTTSIHTSETGACL